METIPAEFVLKVISEESGIPEDQIKPYSTLLSLGLDSLEAACLVQELESQFGGHINGKATTTVSELLTILGAA